MTSRLEVCSFAWKAKTRRGMNAYQAACKWHGVDVIEAGLIVPLADRECRHLRLPGDPGRPCGCWEQEAQLPGVNVRELERAA